MTREERDAAIAEVLGVHATEERLSTITAICDKYATTQCALAITPPRRPGRV